jgi:hypothetical protein
MTSLYVTAAIPLGIYLAWDVLDILSRYISAVRADLSAFAAPCAGIACALMGPFIF